MTEYTHLEEGALFNSSGPMHFVRVGQQGEKFSFDNMTLFLFKRQEIYQKISYGTVKQDK